MIELLNDDCLKVLSDMAANKRRVIVGQKPSEANDEFEAYLCEYIFSNLLWLIFGNEKKIEIKQPQQKGRTKCLKLSLV